MKYLFYTDCPDAILSAWRKLLADGEPWRRLSQSFGWFEFLRRVTGKTGVISVAVNDVDECCGILPCIKLDWVGKIRLLGISIFRYNIRILKVCGGDIIGSGMTNAERREFVEAVLIENSDVDAVFFDDAIVDKPGSGWGDSKSVMSLQNTGKESRYVSAGREKSRVRLLAITGPVPHYLLRIHDLTNGVLSIRSSKSLKKIERRERALSRSVGKPVKIVSIETLEQWDQYKIRINMLLSASWQSQRLGEVCVGGGYEELISRRWLRCFILVAGDDVVAFAECFQGDGVLLYETIAYNQEFAKYSPGEVLRYRLLQDLFDHNTPEYVDFGEGEATYKHQWSNMAYHSVPMMAFRSGSKAHVLLAFDVLVRRIDVSIKRVIKKYAKRG